MGENCIRASVGQDGSRVQLTRDTGVQEDTWLQVRSEWGSAGSRAATQLLVPLERFLARRAFLGRLAKEAGVSIVLDEELRRLVRQANQDQAALRGALDGLAPLDPGALEQRLAGTRYTRELLPFQTRDLGRLLAMLHGANFSVPGAGKTTVTLATYEAERAAGRVERLLIVGPLSAFPAWLEETATSFSVPPVLHRFDGGAIPAPAEIVLANYHKLASNYDALARWVTERPTMVVLDEAHRMKRGWDGQWGSACLNLAYLAKRRDILTGTPAPQSTRDFVALMDYLWPAQATRILPADALTVQPPADAGQRIARALGPLFVRTTKQELDLPPVTRRAIVVPLQGIQRDIYLALKDAYAGQFALEGWARVDLLRMGRVVMYLLEAATNPKLLVAGSLEGADPDVFRHPPLPVPEGSLLSELMARYNEYETPTKFRELARLVKENAEQGRKTLVWSNFVRNLKLLRRQLDAYQPALIHGAVPAFDPAGGISRETEIARFRKDDACRVLLANPAAMSEGMSLHQECHDAVYLRERSTPGNTSRVLTGSTASVSRQGSKPASPCSSPTRRSISPWTDGCVRRPSALARCSTIRR